MILCIPGNATEKLNEAILKFLFIRDSSSVNHFISEIFTSSIFDDSSPYNINSKNTNNNSEKKNIIVGVYGSVYDKDRDFKIKKLREFREKLDDLVKEEYVTDSLQYYCLIASDRKKHHKTK